jgi:hypothetical protein
MKKLYNIKRVQLKNIWKLKEELEVTTFGKSMFPFFTPNTKIQIQNVKNIKILRRNDIILFFNYKKKRIIAHRIRVISKGYIITKGDNCRNHDPSLSTQSDILAFVVGFKKSKKYIHRRSLLWKIFSFYSINRYKIKSSIKNYCYALYHFINKKV